MKTITSTQFNPYLDWATVRRIVFLRLNSSILTPLQIKDLHEDAHARLRIVGDPALTNYDEQD